MNCVNCSRPVRRTTHGWVHQHGHTRCVTVAGNRSLDSCATPREPLASVEPNSEVLIGVDEYDQLVSADSGVPLREIFPDGILFYTDRHGVAHLLTPQMKEFPLAKASKEDSDE